MSESIKKESSVVGGIKGFFQGGPGASKKKSNPNKPFDEKIGDPLANPELFESMVAECVLCNVDIGETVRKNGNKWVLYDDDTEVAKGSYKDRDTAWEKQRILRRAEKGKESHQAADKERKKLAVPGVDTPKKAEQPKAHEQPKAGVQPHAVKKMKKKVRNLESYVNQLFSSLNEGSMVSYVFENNPMSEESATWDNFISHLSKQTVMADQKLNKLLHNIAKMELNCLKKSVETIKNTLEASHRFVVQPGTKIEKDPATNDPRLEFFVAMKDNKKKLKFAVRLDNNRPLIAWEDSKDILDQLGNEESKLLRAELIHIQETAFKTMNDVAVSIEKRDKYLKTLEQKFDKVLSTINPLEMNILKYLLKDKYRSVR